MGIGKSINRVDACEKVTGGAKYMDDLIGSNALIAKVLHSTIANGLVKSMLSRAVAVIRDKTLIINLPGSPKAVRENLEFIITELPHGLAVLKGTVSNCAEK